MGTNTKQTLAHKAKQMPTLHSSGMWEHEFYYNTDHPVYGKAGRAAAEAERRRVAEERAEEKRRIAAIEAEKRRAREEREEARRKQEEEEERMRETYARMRWVRAARERGVCVCSLACEPPIG